MSQSRNRRPASRAREPPRAAAPPAKYTSDAKEHYGNKNTYKIPKSVRYDLENALVGLCDIWFEEIKPHLVKNKVKLHTGGALKEDMEPVREHKSHEERAHRLLDPGAASDIRRTEASCRGYSPTRPTASRAPCPRPRSPSRPTPLSPNNFRKLLQLPDEKRTCQPAGRTRAPSPLSQTYQQDARKSTKQWTRPPVQETSLRQPSPPFTRTRITHQQRDHHTTEQRVANARKQPPGRRPARSPSPKPKPSNSISQQDHYNVLIKDTCSKRKARKSNNSRKPRFPSTSQPPPRQVPRPCCTACKLAACTQTANIPERPLAATQLPPPRSKNTLPSKPPSDNNNNNSKLYRKIPHVSYPTQKPTASILPFPPRVRISPAGDVPQFTQITAGNSAFLQDSSAVQNVFVRNPSHHIHSVNKAPVPPKFGKNSPTPFRATTTSSAGVAPPFQHVAVGNYLSLNVATGNHLPLQNATSITNPIVRKPPQYHSANNVPVPSKFERNLPSPLCGTNISPAVDPSSQRDAAGDSLHRNSSVAVSTAPLPPYFRRESPCPIRGVRILPSPAHAKCMSSAHARSQSPVSSAYVRSRNLVSSAHVGSQSPVSSAHVGSQNLVSSPISPPPSERDEIWFHRFIERKKENLVSVCDIRTSSSQSTTILEENNFQNECNHPLFSKDLIDLIGDTNDERLRVLYENPTREKSQTSVMNLLESRNKNRKTVPKKMPWR